MMLYEISNIFIRYIYNVHNIFIFQLLFKKNSLSICQEMTGSKQNVNKYFQITMGITEYFKS